MTAVSEQLAKLNPNSAAVQLLGRVRSERAAERGQQIDALGGTTLAQDTAAMDAETARANAEQAAL